MSMGWNHGEAWCHGSPLELTAFRVGSTITQDRELAEAFSHKPSFVSISDAGETRHNGRIPGFLYRIAEAISPGDVVPHLRSSVERGKEWIARRELRVVLIGPTQPKPTGLLTEEEIRALRRRQRMQDG
jgi:hypothetical protein